MSTLWAFLAVSAIVIITPGPDTAVTIRNTLFGGRSGGVLTALGIAAGQAIWAFATSIGIVAALIAFEPLFLAIKYAGAAYLVYLGIQALREAAWPSALKNGDKPTAALVLRPARLRAFHQGLISNLGNPKMAVFFASLLPQFVPSGEATFSALMVLGLLFSAMTFAWLVLYAAIIARAGDLLRRPSVYRIVQGITGAFLIGLGVRVAAEQR